MTIEATEGLDGISQSELELDAQIKFIEGMTSDDILNALINEAREKIEIEKEKLKEKRKQLHIQIIENIALIRLIKSQLISLITFNFNNNYFNIYLFNIIGNNSSEKPNN